MPKFRNVRRGKRKFHGNRYTRSVENQNLNTSVNSSVNSPPVINAENSVNSQTLVVDDIVIHNNDGPSHIIPPVTILPPISDHTDAGSSSASFFTSSSFSKLQNHLIDSEMNSTALGLKKSANENRLTGFRFIDFEILSNLINVLACPLCHLSDSIMIKETLRYGNASKIDLECVCGFEHNFWTSKRCKKFKSFEINKRICYSMRSCGLGYAGLKKFCYLMNLPAPLTKRNYNCTIKVIRDVVKQVAIDIMKDSVNDLRVKHSIPEGGNLDTAISCDGSWQRRGYSSLNGFVSVISMESGKVLDIEPMSRFCHGCENQKRYRATDPIKYNILQKSHHCKANYSGSAPSMEVSGAKKIFNRSIEKYNTRYTEYIGDGDSKSFNSIEYTYEGVTVTKKECVGHVQKRVGTRLRNLKKSVKGLSGRGKLTDSMIDRLQNYYGIAIRDNVGNLEAMKKAILASFFHVSSSKKNQWHNYCPTGEKSWCGFQKDIALGTTDYVPGPGLPMSIVLKYIKPVYADLSKDELLMKCLHGRTQNHNESFNGCVWNRLPKTNFIGFNQFELGIYDAVACFNTGNKAILQIFKELGFKPGYFTLAGCHTANCQRLQVAGRKSSSKVKLRRKVVRGLKKAKGDKQTEKEGKSYGAGEF